LELLGSSTSLVVLIACSAGAGHSLVKELSSGTIKHCLNCEVRPLQYVILRPILQSDCWLWQVESEPMILVRFSIV